MVAASRITARNGVERGPTLGKGRVRDRCRRQSRSTWLCRARHQGRRAHRGPARPGGGRGMARHRRDPSQQIAGRLCLTSQRRGRSQSFESHGRAICRRRKPRWLPPADPGRIAGPTAARAARSPIPAAPWRRRSASTTPPKIAPSSSLERCASGPRRRPRCAASCRISRSIAGVIRRAESPWIWSSLSRSDCATPRGRNSACCRLGLENSRRRNRRRAAPPLLRPWRRVQGPCGAMHRPWPGCRPSAPP